MAVDVVLDGNDALKHLAVNPYDVVVLDRDLPGVHGDDICRRLVAENSPTRVLMLTAATTVKERVEGLGLGADDYLPKPFDFAELVARIRTLGRRATPALPPVLEYHDVSLDSSRRVVFRGGRRLELSPKEFALLECLLGAGGRVLSAEELLEHVWDEWADPFHHYSQNDNPPTAGQAGRTAHNRDRPRGRVPHWRCMMELAQRTMTRPHSPKRTIRVRLTVLYGGVFIALLAVALFIIFLVMRAGFITSPGPSGYAFVTSRHVGAAFSLALGITVVVALTLGWLIAGRLLRPLRTITATAKRISATNLHERLELTGPRDELTELGDTLDDLFGRLEGSFESQRRFVANASHELRTPLTAERSVLQVALADPDATEEALRLTCKEVLALGERQEHLIEALLTLASSERGVERPENFDLAKIAEEVLDARRDEAARRDIDLEASLEPAAISGDSDLVESLIANLVDNALRYNVAGGRVDVASRSARRTRRALCHQQRAVGAVGGHGAPVRALPEGGCRSHSQQ